MAAKAVSGPEDLPPAINLERRRKGSMHELTEVTSISTERRPFALQTD